MKTTFTALLFALALAATAPMAACKGQLGESARRLRECSDLQSDVIKRFFRLAVYAGETLSEDTGNAASLALRQKVGVLGSRLVDLATREPYDAIVARMNRIMDEIEGLLAKRK